MTATVFDEPEVQDDSERVFTIATNAFEALPIWMLQRIANAKIAEDIESNPSLLQSIVESANSILEDRIEQGDESIHGVIKGVVRHVDGVGQCFIDTRNVPNGVTGCLKVSRNFIIKDPIKNKGNFSDGILQCSF
jgi:hypothetical protein